MKKKLWIGGLTGLLLLGGALGVSAFSGSGKNDDDRNHNAAVVVKDDQWDDSHSNGVGDGPDDHSKSGGQNQKSMISKEEAIAIATKDTPGKVVEVELDDRYYEIEIKDGKHEVEYKIDLYTGAILEKDVDEDDDSY